MAENKVVKPKRPKRVKNPKYPEEWFNLEAVHYRHVRQKLVDGQWVDVELLADCEPEDAGFIKLDGWLRTSEIFTYRQCVLAGFTHDYEYIPPTHGEPARMELSSEYAVNPCRNLKIWTLSNSL